MFRKSLSQRTSSLTIGSGQSVFSSRFTATTTLVCAAATILTTTSTTSSSSSSRVATPAIHHLPAFQFAEASSSSSMKRRSEEAAANSVLGMNSASNNNNGENSETPAPSAGGSNSGGGGVPPTPPDGSVKYGPAQLIGNKQNPKGIMTLIHGLGDSSYGWAPAAQELSQIHPDLLFFVPTAPTIPVTLNGGQPMPAWYDIVQMGGDVKNDPMMRKNIDWIIYLCYELCQKYNVPLDSVIYAGFSQGAALALHAGLSTQVAQPKGILMMSGRVRALDELQQKSAAGNQASSVPILMCHGTHDPVIALQETAKGRQQMIDRGIVSEENIELKTYQYMQHSTSEEEMLDVSKFIQKLGFTSKI